MDKVAQSSGVSGAQRMRARDTGSSGNAAQPATPSARDMAAQSANRPGGGASVAAASPTPTVSTPLGSRGVTPSMAQRQQGQVAAAQPAQQQQQQQQQQPTWQYNSKATQVSPPTQIGEDSYEVWTGPHQYSGQPVDMKWVLSLQTGGQWQPTQELRASQGNGA